TAACPAPPSRQHLPIPRESLRYHRVVGPRGGPRGRTEAGEGTSPFRIASHCWTTSPRSSRARPVCTRRPATWSVSPATSAMPTLMRGVTIGVLVIQTVERRTFEPYDIDLFQTCAQLITPIVMNARLLSLVDESDDSMQRKYAELASHGIRVAGSPRPRAEHN